MFQGFFFILWQAGSKTFLKSKVKTFFWKKLEAYLSDFKLIQKLKQCDIHEKVDVSL